MEQHQDSAAVARSIIAANLYMTLGTADGDGHPWVSPVFYASNGDREFYWVSSTEATHSRNLASRPRLSIVIFDSRVPAYSGQAVYMAAVAEELAGAEVRPPALHRLYRATVSQHWILCTSRQPGSPTCLLHGRALDHRIPVAL
jgi:nitroimidazol reductase NimA-like FMN-containing flavoprotein (pyridoxamine 5'-phosphate oxidase superfamily)